MMHKIFLVLGCMALGWIGGQTSDSLAQGKSLSVQEIVDRSNLAAYYEGKDGRSHVNMTITDSQGRTRERRFIILRRDDKDGGDQKFYVHFSRPSDVRNMVFMVWKHIGQNDDRWLYLPALDLVKRIAASDKRTSFVGSHFFYEDVSGRNPADDTHELIETTGQALRSQKYSQKSRRSGILLLHALDRQDPLSSHQGGILRQKQKEIPRGGILESGNHSESSNRNESQSHRS